MEEMSSGKDKLNKIEIGLKRLEIINQWISNVDNKSSFILAFAGVTLSLIFTSEVGSRINSVFSYSKTCKLDCNSFLLFIHFVLVILFYRFIIISFWCLYKTLIARLTSKDNNIKEDSNLFFISIASKDYINFEKEVKKESTDDFLFDLNSQIYINSNIASEKFKYYNKSLKNLIYTLLLFIIISIIQQL